jgi:tetratricopeptide (TPR) repeat protein
MEELLERAERLYAKRDVTSMKDAEDLFQTVAAIDRTRIDGLVGMARVEIWLAGHLKDVDDRQKAAARAIDASQWCGRIQPDDAVCDYWLAAALGVQAREKPSTGIKALPLIVDNFKRAAEEVPAYDFGGPDRALALVYLRAPGWPTGPGDPALGVEHARKAIAEAPVYPPNLMALGEALAATGDREGSREAYEKALDQARVRAAAGEDAEAEEWVRDARSALGAPSGEGGGG